MLRIVVSVLLLAATASSQAHEILQQWNAAQAVEAAHLSGKEARNRRTETYDLACRLIEQGMNVEMDLDDQVLIITLNTDPIFAPNTAQLMPEAAVQLQPLELLNSLAHNNSIALLAHTDDTGNATWQKRLCDQRLNALLQYMELRGIDTSGITLYAAGSEEPLNDNDSRQHRAANRRIEIYLLPKQR